MVVGSRIDLARKETTYVLSIASIQKLASTVDLLVVLERDSYVFNACVDRTQFILKRRGTSVAPTVKHRCRTREVLIWSMKLRLVF